jgi:hypothetical protein
MLVSKFPCSGRQRRIRRSGCWIFSRSKLED